MGRIKGVMAMINDGQRYLGNMCTQGFLDAMDASLRANHPDSTRTKSRRRVKRGHLSYSLMLCMAARSHIPSARLDPAYNRSPYGQRHLFYVPYQLCPSHWYAVGTYGVAVGNYKVQTAVHQGKYQYHCWKYEFAKRKFKRTEMPAWGPNNPFDESTPMDEQRWNGDCDESDWDQDDDPSVGPSEYQDPPRMVLIVPLCD